MSKSIKKNFVYQSAYQIMMVISPLITAPYLARTLGAEKIGIYSFNYSIAYYFAIFAIMGLANYGNRAISRVYHMGKKRISKEFWDIFAVQTGASLLVIACYIIYVLFFAGKYQKNATIEIFYILSVCLDISWLYFGIEEFRINMIRTFFVRLGTILAILFFVKSPSDLNLYTFIMAVGAFLATLALWVPLRNYIVFCKPNREDAISHVKPNLILFIPVLSLGVFHYMDKVMVGILSDMTETGYYTNADKVINIPLGLITALGVVMMPRISKLEERGDEEKAKGYIQNSLIFSSWLGVAMCFGIMAVSEVFVPVFFGRGYEACVKILMLFSPVILIKAVSAAFKMQVMIPTGKDVQLNISVICAAAANLILNCLFIPKYGAVGAVIGTALAEAILLVFYGFWSRNYVDFRINGKWLLLFAISGVVMFAVVRKVMDFVEGQLLSLSVGILTGVLVYLVLSAAEFRLVGWEPYLGMARSLKRRFRRQV